ncbi:MAG: SPFH domain-containing protein [Flavobacteriales bacterium]|nr:SPFH domain-containing protein [Flavobacteriales bacterium]
MIWNKLKNEFIDIIEWIDSSNDTMVYRFERYQNEIKNGAKLTVRPGQAAVFINEGKIADVFREGMYTLNTENLPILATLKGWKYGFNSPFKAEVYFVKTTEFVNLGWGTQNPIPKRDPEFGMVRLRAFGTYQIKISDPGLFIEKIVGTDGNFTQEQITGQLRSIVLTRFSDSLGELQMPMLDLITQYDEVSKAVQTKIKPEFDEYGIELTKFLVNNITPPKEVEEIMDKRTSMGIVGNMQQYTQFQAANAMEAAAKNPGGDAGAGIGMGMGFAMAGQMAQSMNPLNQQNQANQAGNQAVPPPLTPVSFHIALNGQQAGPFDMNTISNMVKSGQLNGDTLVWKQGMAGWEKASTVSEISALLNQVPPPVPPPIV